MAIAEVTRKLTSKKHRSLSPFCASGCLVLLSLPCSASAENTIIVVVNSDGRVVFTNKQKATLPVPASATAIAAKEEPAKHEPPKPEASKIFKVVDERGVVHFSNVEN